MIFLPRLMQALENRFKFLSSEHEFVTICNGMDKVLAFERGDLVFVVNLDPNRSYEGYQACDVLGGSRM